MSAFFAAFGAGLAASLSPCVYPLIPITVGFFGTQARERRMLNVVSYALGQIIAFAGVGAFAVAAGETLGFSSESSSVNLGVGLALLLAGAIALYGRIPGLGYITMKLRRGPRQDMSVIQRPRGWIGALFLGVGSALVASPCTSPILAGVLATMATTATLGRGLALMLVYAVGFSSLFLVLGLGLVKLPRSGRWMVYVHKLSAVVLIAAGVLYLKRGL